MKTRLIAALCLFLATLPVAFPSVRVKSIPESLQQPRITVLLNGVPVPGAIVEIERQYQYPKHNEKLRRRFTTDGKGQVVLPKLPYGLYRIVASAKANLTADLYLNFSNRRLARSSNGGPLLPGESGKERFFSMELRHIPSREQTLEAEEQLPITKCSAFRGVVRDQSGAPVPNVHIKIVRMGTNAKTRAWRLHSNPQGKFSVSLKDGDYIAFFARSGFSTRVLHLEITKREIRSELHVLLQVAPMTE